MLLLHYATNSPQHAMSQLKLINQNNKMSKTGCQNVSIPDILAYCLNIISVIVRCLF